ALSLSCIPHRSYMPDGGADATGGAGAGDAAMDLVDEAGEAGDGGPAGGDAGSDVATDGGSDARMDAQPPSVSPPRLLSPLSTANVMRIRPTLHWVLADGSNGVRVQICADRACTAVQTTFDAVGSSGAPPDPLTPGVWFWRAYGKAAGMVGTT